MTAKPKTLTAAKLTATKPTEKSVSAVSKLALLGLAAKPSGLSATTKILVSTTQSQSMWSGRGANPAQPNGRVSMPLAMALMRLPYDLTGSDNPLADATLLHLERGLLRLRGDCAERIETVIRLLEERKRMGITTAIASAREPIELECSFGTPYHYLLIDALAIYDSAVRHLLTVSLTGLLSHNQVRITILGLSKDFSRLLYEFVKMASTLRKSGVEVTRTSLLSNAAHQTLLAAWGVEHGAVSEKVISGKEDEARALIRQLFVSSGDIEPNEAENTLTIRIHRAATPAHDKALAALLDDLTQLEFQHPETGAKMIFSLVYRYHFYLLLDQEV